MLAVLAVLTMMLTMLTMVLSGESVLDVCVGDAGVGVSVQVGEAFIAF